MTETETLPSCRQLHQKVEAVEILLFFQRRQVAAVLTEVGMVLLVLVQPRPLNRREARQAQSISLVSSCQSQLHQ